MPAEPRPPRGRRGARRPRLLRRRGRRRLEPGRAGLGGPPRGALPRRGDEPPRRRGRGVGARHRPQGHGGRLAPGGGRRAGRGPRASPAAGAPRWIRRCRWTPDGRVVVVWRQVVGSRLVRFADLRRRKPVLVVRARERQAAATRWDRIQTLSSPRQTAGRPDLAIDGRGVALATWHWGTGNTVGGPRLPRRGAGVRGAQRPDVEPARRASPDRILRPAAGSARERGRRRAGGRVVAVRPGGRPDHRVLEQPGPRPALHGRPRAAVPIRRRPRRRPRGVRERHGGGRERRRAWPSTSGAARCWPTGSPWRSCPSRARAPAWTATAGRRRWT